MATVGRGTVYEGSYEFVRTGIPALHGHVFCVATCRTSSAVAVAGPAESAGVAVLVGLNLEGRGKASR
jgi:hypothetical protein